MRERILTAAVSLFCEKGFSRTTFGDIAKRTGMTTAGIYNYFEDKQTLLAAAADYFHVQNGIDKKENLIT